jgi:metal-responsive CopG/Arc/MetJ family transcriptional regulator
LSDATVETVDEYADENHSGNRSEAVWELLSKGLRYDERVSLETDRDRLQHQLRVTNARQEDVSELVEYVEGEKRIRDRRNAPMWRRAKRFVLGAPK